MVFTDELLVKDFWALQLPVKGFDLALGYFLGRGRPLIDAISLASKVFPNHT